jgi:hypothetical protein
MRIAGRQAESHGCPSIRGNPMNLGVPSASGCTLMLVESSATASILMRMSCFCCNSANTLSKTPALAQRFIRV